MFAVAAVAAGLGVARVRPQRVDVSAAFIVYILAGAFLGPTSAFVAAILSEVMATRVIRTRRQAFLFNLVAAGVAALLAGTLIRDVAPHEHTAGFYLVLGGLALAMLALTWLIIAPFSIAFDGNTAEWSPRTLLDYLPSALITVALTVAGAAIYIDVGLGGIAFALAAGIAFSYMAHLLDRSRQRAEQYVSLSWGVLAGLLRALDIREGAPPGMPRPWRGSPATWPRRSVWASTSRSLPTPPDCCTTSGTSRCRTASRSAAGR